MTNKEFQNMLAQYPDDYYICMDNVFGWESVHNMIDPHLYINTDIGQIEIVPDEYRNIWNFTKDGKLPEDGMIIIASFMTPNGIRRYEKVTYPETPITDIMDMWFEIPTIDKF